ncbi:MAG: homocitrate synthase, partial [Anaerolineae bacterium]
FGVECLELTSPLASPQSYEDAKSITRLDLSCQVLTHVRCRMDDAKRAIETGVDGLDVVIGTSSMLREFSHGKGIDEIIDLALEVVTFVRSQGIRVRFSTEDSFRSDTRDLFRIYEAVDKIGVHRVGIADTVGVATPRQVYELVRELRQRVTCDIEFHGHNDSGCAIANAFEALDAGATHVDTTVLGIGERNGITPLGGLIARLYATNPASVAKYDLPLLRTIDNTVAQIVGVDVPFNNYITGIAAFTHKAGIHAKAILNNPETYEILNPQAFGLTRYISIAHRLTGWNAIKNRSEQLGLTLDDDHIKMITEHIKALADEKALSLDDVDALLRRWANDLLT